MRLNFRFLVYLTLFVVAIAGVTFSVHRYQVNRGAALMLTLARQARDAGNVSDAGAMYRQYLSLDPDSAEASAELGEMLADTGELQDAYFRLYESLRLDPEQPSVRRRLVDVALALGRAADAKQLLLGEGDADLQRDPKRLWLLARTEESLREFDEAREHLEMAVEAAPGEPDYAKSLADLLVQRFSEFDLARQRLDRLVADSPTNPRCYLTRGRWLLERASRTADADRAGELATAAWDDAQRGSRLAPGDPELAVLSADAAIARGTPLQAMEPVRKALAADPKQPDLYVALAQIELNSENPDGAIESFKKGLREIPGNPDLLWSLSLLELESGDYAAVRALLEQLRAQNYSQAAIRLLEARLLIADGKAREAADLLEKSRSHFDRSEPLLNQADYQLAVCYRMLGNPDQELAALRRVLGSDPLSVRAREDLAMALLKAGRRQEALAEYAQIVRQPNRSIGAIVNYAQLLFLDGLGEGHSGQDWAHLRSVLALLDSMPEAADYVTVLRSDLLATEGDLQAAERLLQDKIKRDPESTIVRRALIAFLVRNRKWEQVERTLQAAEQAVGDSPALRLEKARYLVQRYGEEVNERGQLHALSQPAPDWTAAQRIELAAGFATLFLALEDYPASERCARSIARETTRPSLELYLLLFDLAIRSGNVDAMNEALARVREIEGDDGPLGRIGEAVRLTVAAEALPDTDEARRETLYDRALTELAEAAVQRPAWSRIPRLRGDIYDLQGQSELAVQSYLQAIELGEQDTRPISRAVFLLFEQGRYAEADRVVRKLQERKTTFSSELTRVASEVSLRLDDFERARSLAESSAEQSDRVEDHLWLAQVHRIGGDFAAAEKAYRAAASIDPTEPAAWVSLVQMLARQDDLETAAEVIEEARGALASDVVDDAIAQCYQAIGDQRRAEQSYRRAAEADPGNPLLIQRVADFYLQSDNFSEAEPYLLRLAGEAPGVKLDASEVERRWARRSLGLRYGLQGDPGMFERGESLIRTNLKEDENSLEDQRVLAMIYGGRREPESLKQAVTLLEGVIRQQPQFSLGDHFLLAEFFSRQDDWTRYSRTMRRVMSNGGAEEPRYVASYAAALLQRGELPEARLWLNRLKVLAPDDQTTDTIEAELLFKSQQYGQLLSLLRTKAEEPTRRPWSAGMAEMLASQLVAQQASEDAQPLMEFAEEVYVRIAAADPEQKDELTAFYTRQGPFKRAYQRLRDPEIDPDTLAGICQLALQNDQFADDQLQQLLELNRDALRRHPANEAVGLCVADFEAWLGRWEPAIEAYRAVLTAHPDSIAALNNLGMILAMSGQRLDLASRAVDRAVEKFGVTDFLHDTRGLVRLAAGRPGLAEQDFRAAIAMDAMPDRYFHLAQALQAQQKLDAARAAMELAQEAGISERQLHPLERGAYRQLADRLSIRLASETRSP